VGRRGWILIVGVVLLMAAVTASLAPAPQEGDGGDGDQAAPPATRPADDRPPGRTREIALDAARNPATEEVARGTHVVLRVSVSSAAEVAVPGLGLTGFAEPGTPAVFDLLAERTGRFDIMVEAAEGEPRRAGTLVVR
jgi:hypothetical protein